MVSLDRELGRKKSQVRDPMQLSSSATKAKKVTTNHVMMQGDRACEEEGGKEK